MAFKIVIIFRMQAVSATLLAVQVTMSMRTLIYPFSFIAFAPAMLLFMAGMILIVPATILDLAKGHFSTFQYLFLLAGGGAGLASALLITFDIAGRLIIDFHLWLKRFGLIVGFASELVIIYIFTPNNEPFIYYWLPQLVGAVVLFGLSFNVTANKSM
jgi:hypothetical protein